MDEAGIYSPGAAIQYLPPAHIVFGSRFQCITGLDIMWTCTTRLRFMCFQSPHRATSLTLCSRVKP